MDKYCLDIIDRSFTKLRDEYISIKVRFGELPFDSKKEIVDYHALDANGFSPKTTLVSKYKAWNDSIRAHGLKDEIEKNIVKSKMGEGGYFALVENVFDKNYNFILNNFKGSAVKYFNEKQTVERLNEEIHNLGNTSLKWKDFLLAVEFEFISYLELFENLYRKYYGKFKIILNSKVFLPEKKINTNRLIIDTNRVSVQSLYQFLAEASLVQASFEEFESHFSQYGEPEDKIMWLGTLMQLVILFEGSVEQIKNSGTVKITSGISLVNSKKNLVIGSNFKSHDGTDFNVGTIKTFINKNPTPKSEGNKFIINYLKEISVTNPR